MANLTRAWRWERFAPDLGDNLSLPEGERLYLEVASGLSGEQLAAFHATLRDMKIAGESVAEVVAAWAGVFSPVVRLVGEHTIEGRDVKSLGDYLRLLAESNGVYNLTEMVSIVTEFNSVSGTSALFSRRHSGGVLSTRAQSAVKAEARPAAH